MAKKSKIAREKRIIASIQKYRSVRAEWVAILKGHRHGYAEKIMAMEKLSKLPRNSSATRLRNRCAETGRPRGFYRKFGLSRNLLRKYLMMGYIPGGRKASW